MIFTDVKAALQALLVADGSTNGYQVLGYQLERENFENALDDKRTARVFYASGSFPKGGGSINGPVDHDITFRVELYAAKRADGDLAALDDPNSTDGERATALATFQHAALLADESMDEFIELVYTVIMDTRNRDFGRTLPEGIIADRWITSVQKDSPAGDGEFAGLSALITVTCTVVEDLAGDTGLLMTEGFDNEYSINQDPDVDSGTENTPIAGQILAK